MSSQLRIQSVRLAECPLPLPQPIRLGRSEIRTRDFLALRVETDADIAGEAIGYVRGTPLFAALEVIGRRLIGADALMRRDLVRQIDVSNVPGRAALTRALSLLDIALWDIAAKLAGLPLFKLIGALADTAPASAVAGYRMNVRTVDDVATEVSRRFDEGYPRVKVMLHGEDAAFDRKVLAAASSTSGRVAADAHWSWSSLTDARRYCRPLDALELDFLEDPFCAADGRLSLELQTEMRTPIAAGEDLHGPAQFDQLVRGIGLLRVDATTCGGVSGAIEAINVAAAAGRNVLPHVFAALHVQLACAFPNVEGVEVIPADVGADPIDVLVRNSPECAGGVMRANAQPGAGLLLNWQAVDRFASRAQTIDTA